MKRRGIRVCSIAMLTLAIMLVTATGITSFASGDVPMVGTFNGSGNLQLATVEVPEEAEAYANNIAGVLMADVYGNEEGFGIEIDDYTDLSLGEPYTVMSQSEEQIYSFPVLEGGDIKMILNVFEIEGEWNATLGKNYADELNELRNDSDEEYMLFVEDGNIMAENSAGKVLIEKTNYEYDDSKMVDFEADMSYDDRVNRVEDLTDSNVRKSRVTRQFSETGCIQDQMAVYNSDFYEEYREYFEGWIRKLWEIWSGYDSDWNDWNDNWDDMTPDTPTDGGNDVMPDYPTDGGDDVMPDYPTDGGDDVMPDYPTDGGDDVMPDYPTDGGDDVIPDFPTDDGDVVIPNDPFLPDEEQEDSAPVVTTPPSDNTTDDSYDGSGIGANAANPFKVDTDVAKTLNTDGCTALQQDKNGRERGLCWAATVATMVNYRSGKRMLESYTIADEMNINYDSGGTMYDMTRALSNYGYSYGTSNQQLSMDSVVSYINDKQPLGLCAYSSAGGHAVTIVGYSNESNNKTLTIWNSGNHQMQTCTYQSSGTSFTYGGYRFTWYSTVYPN